ncbi:Proteasome activator complex subunit 4 [Eumeta japonica]|uniref:Proteasome activator complex subunit 4 n=1 Tax=Eumeta variegata TaxID=151549 RepID=A0A4C1WUP3_EUMVA|nr:Proteasome activator complex subunit 4 [Eumeta japonica]
MSRRGAMRRRVMFMCRLEQSFHELLRHYFPTTNTKTKMSPGCIVAASVLLNEAEKSDPNFMDCFNTAGARELAICDRNETLYYNLVNELVKIAETPSVDIFIVASLLYQLFTNAGKAIAHLITGTKPLLHPSIKVKAHGRHRRRLELTMHLLTFCPIKESPYPPNAIRLILNSLIHDNITVRRIATTLMVFVLKQRKRKAKKIKIDPYEIAGIPRPKEHAPGYRKDLEWAMWSDAGVPNTDEEWDKPWLKTSDYGFYTWPQELMVSAPTSDQPPINRKPEEMEEGEKCIYEFFMDEEKMNQLINYLTVEEKKGKDKFSAIRFFMFKYLFSSFGETITMKFLERALTYAGNAQEASQRSAAEIAAAAVRAPRYWPRESAIRVYEESVKVLKIGLTAIIPETVEDWTVCVLVALENQDPRRAAIVFEAVMELCLPASDADADQESSFGVCARIHAFRGILNTLSWRGAPLASALLRRLCAANFIQHPYHNVRDSIVGLLMYIFNTELVFTGGQAGPAPRLADFIAEIKPKLAPLYDSNGEIRQEKLMAMYFYGRLPPDAKALVQLTRTERCRWASRTSSATSFLYTIMPDGVTPT